VINRFSIIPIVKQTPDGLSKTPGVWHQPLRHDFLLGNLARQVYLLRVAIGNKPQES
jgi:hypothetical protein